MPDLLRIFISGYYGYSNPGDEAILSVLLSELRSNLSKVSDLSDLSVTVVSGTPDETKQTHQVEAVLWSDPHAIAQAVRESDLVITGGGGIFHDYGGFPEDGLLTEGNWGLGFHVTAGLLAALFGKPLVIYGVGVGPLFSEAGRRFTRAVCEAASAITVRDQGSRELLEGIGVSPSVVRVTADPAFLFPPASSKRTEEILSAEKVPDAALRIGVCIRHWSHGVQPEKWEAEVAAGLDTFLDHRSGQVVFLPFQQFPGEQEDDLAVAARVWDRMKHRESAHILRGNYSPAEKAAVLAACRLVVGMRLHSLIFSITAGVPFVALTYDEKVRQLVERTGTVGIPMIDLRASVLAAGMEQTLDTPAVDPSPLIALAKENTTAMLAVLRSGKSAIPELRGEPLEMVRSSIMALLATQKQLRFWLSDQKINYEYQVRTQQQELDELRPLSLEVPRLEGELETARKDREEAEHRWQQQLAATETARQQWEARSAELEEDKSALLVQKTHLEDEQSALERKLARLQALHEGVVADWQTYGEEMNRRLGLYRSQRAWRAMLAIRKAYVLLVCQGWSGRLRFLPWLVSLLVGRGAIETEQLEFPLRPKPRNSQLASISTLPR